jgi:hypothetical protein
VYLARRSHKTRDEQQHFLYFETASDIPRGSCLQDFLSFQKVPEIPRGLVTAELPAPEHDPDYHEDDCLTEAIRLWKQPGS